MLRIEQTYLIKASPERVWAALTDPVLQAKWTGQPAEYDARVGGHYKLWANYVTGRVLECDPPTALAQTWQPNDWTIKDSVVSFLLKKVPGGTQVELLHENVQAEDYHATMQGWDQFYIGAIKAMLEGEDIKPKAKAKATTRKTARAKKSTSKLKRAPAGPRKVAAAKKKKAA